MPSMILKMDISHLCCNCVDVHCQQASLLWLHMNSKHACWQCSCCHVYDIIWVSLTCSAVSTSCVDSVLLCTAVCSIRGWQLVAVCNLGLGREVQDLKSPVHSTWNMAFIVWACEHPCSTCKGLLLVTLNSSWESCWRGGIVAERAAVFLD